MTESNDYRDGKLLSKKSTCYFNSWNGSGLTGDIFRVCLTQHIGRKLYTKCQQKILQQNIRSKYIYSYLVSNQQFVNKEKNFDSQLISKS